MEEILFWGHQAILTVLLVASPVLLAALAVGTAVSLIQSMTQIQEITLVFVPKIVTVFLMLLLTGGWMLEQARTFATSAFESTADWRR